MKKTTLTLLGLLMFSLSIFAQKPTVTAVEATKSGIRIQLKDSINPDIYIDGKKYDHAILELLDQSKIASMNVIKGEEAIEEFGAPYGVIEITSKKAAAMQAGSTDGSSQLKIRSKKGEDGDPLLIIDGREASHDELAKYDPDDISRIQVYKGEEAMRKYSAPNGAVVVKTKKGKNKKKKK